jgi:hypothetical protein
VAVAVLAVAVKMTKAQPVGVVAVAVELVLLPVQVVAAAIPAVRVQKMLAALPATAMRRRVVLVADEVLLVKTAKTASVPAPNLAAQVAQRVITLSVVVLLRGPPQVRVKVQQLNWSRNEQHQIQNQRFRRGQQLPADFVCFRYHGQCRPRAVPRIRIPAHHHVAGCQQH